MSIVPIQFSGHGVEVTDMLRDFINKKFERFQKHSHNITSIHVYFSADREVQKAEVIMHITGAQIVAKAESDDMYKTIDLLVDKVVRQLDKHKDKH